MKLLLLSLFLFVAPAAIPQVLPLQKVLPHNAFTSLKEPAFINLREAEGQYEPNTPLAVVQVAGIEKAYPLAYLLYHPIITDFIGGQKIIISYCALSGSLRAYALRFMHKGYQYQPELSATGYLRGSNLVLGDSSSGSLFQQFNGRGISGVFAGAQLKQLPSLHMSYATFSRVCPYGLIMQPIEHPVLPYAYNPYPKLEDITAPRPVLLQPKPGFNEYSMLYALAPAADSLRKEFLSSTSLHRLTQGEWKINEIPADEYLVIINFEAGPSPTEGFKINDGELHISELRYVNSIDGEQLSFKKAAIGPYFTDVETGSRWSIWGRCLSGKHKGKQLQPIPLLTGFAFVFEPFSRLK
jgi:hypothetical protein